jgi:hypothetical protein
MHENGVEFKELERQQKKRRSSFSSAWSPDKSCRACNQQAKNVSTPTTTKRVFSYASPSKYLPTSPVNTSQRLQFEPRTIHDRLRTNQIWHNRQYHFLQQPTRQSKAEKYSYLLNDIDEQILPESSDINHRETPQRSYTDYLEALRWEEQQLYERSEMEHYYTLKRKPFDRWYELKDSTFTEQITRFNDTERSGGY